MIVIIKIRIEQKAIRLLPAYHYNTTDVDYWIIIVVISSEPFNKNIVKDNEKEGDNNDKKLWLW